MCDECSEFPSVKRCVTCNKWLCEDDCASHTFAIKTRDHKIVDMTELKKDDRRIVKINVSNAKKQFVTDICKSNPNLIVYGLVWTAYFSKQIFSAGRLIGKGSIAIATISALVDIGLDVRKFYKKEISGKMLAKNISISIISTAASFGGGLLVGPALGAAIGSFIPVVGTALGFIIGGIISGYIAGKITKKATDLVWDKNDEMKYFEKFNDKKLYMQSLGDYGADAETTNRRLKEMRRQRIFDNHPDLFTDVDVQRERAKLLINYETAYKIIIQYREKYNLDIN